MLSLLTSCILAPLKKSVDYLRNKSAECHEVQDVYYYPDKLYNPSYFAITQRCPYTLNELNNPLPMIIVKRKFYNDYAAEYTRYGLDFPYPKREGDSGVLPTRY